MTLPTDVENHILDFQTPDEAARFLMWFGRSGNREQIDERVIKGVQKEGCESYRAEVARSALGYFENLVFKAQRMAGSEKSTSISSKRLMGVLVDVYLHSGLPQYFWKTNVDPCVQKEIERRADEYLKEYT